MRIVVILEATKSPEDHPVPQHIVWEALEEQLERDGIEVERSSYRVDVRGIGRGLREVLNSERERRTGRPV